MVRLLTVRRMSTSQEVVREALKSPNAFYDERPLPYRIFFFVKIGYQIIIDPNYPEIAEAMARVLERRFKAIIGAKLPQAVIRQDQVGVNRLRILIVYQRQTNLIGTLNEVLLELRKMKAVFTVIQRLVRIEGENVERDPQFRRAFETGTARELEFLLEEELQKIERQEPSKIQLSEEEKVLIIQRRKDQLLLSREEEQFILARRRELQSRRPSRAGTAQPAAEERTLPNVAPPRKEPQTEGFFARTARIISSALRRVFKR